MGELRNRLIMKIIISLIILNLVCSLAGVLGETDTTPRNTNRNIDFGLEILLEDQTSQTNLTLYPGEHYVGSVEITNLGAENDTFNLTLTGIPTGWAVTFDNSKWFAAFSVVSQTVQKRVQEQVFMGGWREERELLTDNNNRTSFYYASLGRKVLDKNLSIGISAFYAKINALLT